MSPSASTRAPGCRSRSARARSAIQPFATPSRSNETPASRWRRAPRCRAASRCQVGRSAPISPAGRLGAGGGHGRRRRCLGRGRCLSREALAQERGVHDPAGQVRGVCGPPQRGRQRGTDGHHAARIRVCAHQVGGRVVARQAAGPGANPGRDARRVELRSREGCSVADRHVDAEPAAHGRGAVDGARQRRCRGGWHGRDPGRGRHGLAPGVTASRRTGASPRVACTWAGAGEAMEVATPTDGAVWPDGT